MTLTIYTIILALIGLYYIFDRTTRFIRKEPTQTLFKLVTTLIIWIPVVVIALFPTAAMQVLAYMGLGDNVNTLFLLVFVIIIIFQFKLLAIIEKIEKNITEIVRKEALKELEQTIKKN
jgi:hypothetical protein